MAGKSPYAIDLTSEERAELEQRAAVHERAKSNGHGPHGDE